MGVFLQQHRCLTIKGLLIIDSCQAVTFDEGYKLSLVLDKLAGIKHHDTENRVW